MLDELDVVDRVVKGLDVLVVKLIEELLELVGVMIDERLKV